MIADQKMTRWSHLGFTLFLFFSSELILFTKSAYASEPRTPNNGSEILENLSATSNQQSNKLKTLRKNLETSPNNLDLASQLAKAYIGIARENTDVRYYGYAQAVLKPWWEKQNPPVEALLLRATLNQQRHQYTKAIDDLKLLLKRQPRHAQAWLTLSIIQQVQGNYQSARASCSALSRVSSIWLSNLCHSQVLGYTGSTERAYKMQQALALQLKTSRPDLLQWILGISAETALRMGKKKQAEINFEKALKLPLRDAYLLRIYSDYLLEENREAVVLKLLKDEEKDSALLLRMAIAAKRANQKQLMSDYQKLLESRFKAARLRGSNLHERDEALYLLEFAGDLKKALKLARNNWNVQKEPDDALILLRAALASHSETDVQTIRNWIAQTQLQDFRIQKLLDKPETGATDV